MRNNAATMRKKNKLNHMYDVRKREKAEMSQRTVIYTHTRTETQTIGRVIKSYKSIKASVSFIPHIHLYGCRTELIRWPPAPSVESTEIQFKAPPR